MMNKIVLLVLVCQSFLVHSISAAKEKDWWEHATFYQIYPRSLMDSDADGVGDLVGITSKLDHLKDIGINAIWMSPMFESPQKDFGYDVSDFYAVHHEYGTMEDFENFMKKANELEIGVLLDFVPNHSSNLCEWFIKSELGNEEYKDYYTWHDGHVENNVRVPPNNWRSVFGGSAWTWSSIRNQWYLHQFLKEQPDLNYRNPKVVEAMTDVLQFWLKKGIAGFRIDATNHMYEDNRFLDEPENEWADPESFDFTEHIYTKDQPETYELIYNWRKMLNEWSEENKSATKILMTEAYASIEDTMRYYESSNGTQGAHLPFNFQLLYVEKDGSAQDLKNTIDYWLNYMPVGHSTSWVIGSHDHNRVATKMGPELASAMHTINLMLPGTSITYYGDEIGMTDNNNFVVSDDRDPCRTPMQWDDTVSAGFSTSTSTWLPVNANYRSINVKLSKETERSHYHHFKELTSLRSQPSIINGDINSKALSKEIFAFIREYNNHPTYVIVVNLADTAKTIDLTEFVNLPDTLWVASSSPTSEHRIDNEIQTAQLSLGKYDALVLRSGAVSLSVSCAVFVVALAKTFLYY